LTGEKQTDPTVHLGCTPQQHHRRRPAAGVQPLESIHLGERTCGSSRAISSRTTRNFRRQRKQGSVSLERQGASTSGSRFRLGCGAGGLRVAPPRALCGGPGQGGPSTSPTTGDGALLEPWCRRRRGDLALLTTAGGGGVRAGQPRRACAVAGPQPAQRGPETRDGSDCPASRATVHASSRAALIWGGSRGPDDAVDDRVSVR